MLLSYIAVAIALLVILRNATQLSFTAPLETPVGMPTLLSVVSILVSMYSIKSNRKEFSLLSLLISIYSLLLCL